MLNEQLTMIYAFSLIPVWVGKYASWLRLIHLCFMSLANKCTDGRSEKKACPCTLFALAQLLRYWSWVDRAYILSQLGLSVNRSRKFRHCIARKHTHYWLIQVVLHEILKLCKLSISTQDYDIERNVQLFDLFIRYRKCRKMNKS